MSDRPAVFRALHSAQNPFRLVNAWDRLSARVFALAGAPAIGTSSFAVALANGYLDGQHIPAAHLAQVVADITSAVDVPVSVDIEAGYGPEPADVERVVGEVLAAGAVGINIEDGRPDAPGHLFEASDQCRRIAAAREHAGRDGVDLFINARCDVYFGAQIDPDQRCAATVARLAEYVRAGADGVFVPGLIDLDVMAEVTSSVPAPLNVMLWPGLPPVEELADAGVRRISQGGSAFLHAAGYLHQMATAYLQGDEPSSFGGDVPQALQLLPGLVAQR